MAKQTINIGTTPNDGTGDPLRTAFTKVNENFTELYDRPVFEGSYDELTNKPTIPTDISELTDTQGLLNVEDTELSYLELTNSARIIETVLLGEPINFIRSAEGNETDSIDEGLTLARGANGALYNSEVEERYDDTYHLSPAGTKWNSDGWGNLLNLQFREYTTFREALNNRIGENILNAELVMHDTINDKYYKFSFSDWGQNNGGSFEYTRTLITDPNYFIKENYGDQIDIFYGDDGEGISVGITRANNQGIFNPYLEESWDSDISPEGTLWNLDGWDDFSNIQTRNYTNFYEAYNGNLGNNIPNSKAVMYIPDRNSYYAIQWLSWTRNNEGGGFSYIRYKIDLDEINEGIKFADGTKLNSAEGLSRVKSTASNNRKIEEVVGNKTIFVTEVVNGDVETATIRNNSSSWDFYVNANENLNYLYQNTDEYRYLQFSFDQENSWIDVSFGGGSPNNYYQMVFEDGIERSVEQNTEVVYRTVSGGDPVVWWNKNELPEGPNNFRGAIIDYHAYTGEATFIGTIHIVDDDGEEHITHTEVSSGSEESQNDDLWFVQNEGTISYRRLNGERRTLKIHWSAKVFYGSEYYDD